MGALGVAAAVLGTGLGVGLARRRLDVETLAGEAASTLPDRRVVLHDSRGAAHRARVESVRVVRRPRHGDAPAVEEVSLLLATDAPGGVYALDSDAVRVAPLHYLPVGAQDRSRRLEAVVTRIV